MTDLVKQLREYAIHMDAWGQEANHDADIVEEAADRIEKLEAALKFYASTKNYKQIWHEKRQMWVSDITSDQGNIARKALEGKDE